VRAQIVTTLGFIGGPEAVAALNSVSGESDPDVRKMISAAQLRRKRIQLSEPIKQISDAATGAGIGILLQFDRPVGARATR
jgi:hypothetical protein